MNINVFKLYLNGRSLLLTCVAYHLSWVSGAFGSRTSALLLCLKTFSRVTSARYWFCLRSSLIVDNCNMSIQASLKRFKSNENLSIHLTISMFSSSCSGELIKPSEEHTLSSFDEVGSQRVPEILDSIGCSQRFSVKKSFVHFCISDNSVLQCWTSFFCFKHCKIQPVIDQLLILKPGR